MKRLLLMLFLSISIYSQTYDNWVRTDTLVAGTDTLVVDTLKSFANKLDLTVVDTGSTYTDSVIVEIYDPKLAVWVPLSVGKYSDMTEYAYAIPGAGNSRIFQILFGSGSKDLIIRQRLANTQFVNGRRVLTSLKITNNY